MTVAAPRLKVEGAPHAVGGLFEWADGCAQAGCDLLSGSSDQYQRNSMRVVEWFATLLAGRDFSWGHELPPFKCRALWLPVVPHT